MELSWGPLQHLPVFTQNLTGKPLVMTASRYYMSSDQTCSQGKFMGGGSGAPLDVDICA